tara:strand:+ start:3358 stop:3798 length:441 start_codon:yes stop_codon:yes gene_type:complete
MNYQKTILVNTSKENVYKAITTEIDKWWTIHSNIADKLNDKLTVRFGETTVKEMLITELKTNKKITWKVTKAHIDIKELTTKDEWVGTEIKWEIISTKDSSEIHFEHKGLIPEFECYNACESGWDYFLESLKLYLNNGKGMPHGIE